MPAKFFQVTWSEAVKIACQANIFNGFQLTRKELKVAIIRYLGQLDESDTESDRAIGQGTYLGVEKYRIVVSVAAAFCLKHYDTYSVDVWSKIDDTPVRDIKWEFEAGQFCFAVQDTLQNKRLMYGVIIAQSDGENSFDDYDAIAFDCCGFHIGSTKKVHYLVSWFNFGLCLVPAADLIPIAPFTSFLKFKYDYWQLEGEEIRQKILENLTDLLTVTDENDPHYARLLGGSKWLGSHSIGGDRIAQLSDDSEESEVEKRQIDLFDANAIDQKSKSESETTEAGKAIATNKKVEGKAKPKAGDLGYVEVLDDKAIEIVDDNLAFWSDEVVQVLYKKFADEVSLRHLG